MAPIHRLAAGFAVLSLAWATTAVSQAPDHLECFKVRDSQARATYRVDVAGLVAEPGCVIRVPGTLFCTQTTKSNVDPLPPGGGGGGGPAGRFLCYKLKCPKAALPTVTWNDQYGSRTLTTRRSSLICAPEIVTTTTTTTTSPTTTTFCNALGAPCGSCGNGVCLILCPGNAFVCVANTTVGGPGPCSGDSECTDPGYPTCSGIQAHCSAGSTANPGGCRPLCP